MSKRNRHSKRDHKSGLARKRKVNITMMPTSSRRRVSGRPIMMSFITGSPVKLHPIKNEILCNNEPQSSLDDPHVDDIFFAELSAEEREQLEDLVRWL